MHSIPAVVIEPTSEADRLEMQLVENIAREDMTDTDISSTIRDLIEKTWATNTALAARLGRSEAWVRRVLSLQRPSTA